MEKKSSSATIKVRGNDIIVHELLHFCVPNHGKLWKSLMRLHLGEYETCEAELKNMANIKDNAAEGHR